MGLEKHVDIVFEKSFDDFAFPCQYRWEEGCLIVEEFDEAMEIMRILRNSEEFAPMFYDTVGQKIVFGNITKGNFIDSLKVHIKNMDAKRQQDLLLSLIDHLYDDFYDFEDARLDAMEESVKNIAGIEFEYE